jgi:hypothetical protein
LCHLILGLLIFRSNFCFSPFFNCRTVLQLSKIARRSQVQIQSFCSNFSPSPGGVFALAQGHTWQAINSAFTAQVRDHEWMPTHHKQIPIFIFQKNESKPPNSHEFCEEHMNPETLTVSISLDSQQFITEPLNSHHHQQ